MSGFVKEVTPRMQALHIVSEGLSFPWHVRTADVPIDFALGKRISGDVEARKVSSLHKEPQRWLCSTKFRCSGCDSRPLLIFKYDRRYFDGSPA